MLVLSIIMFFGGLGLIGFAVKLEVERRKAKQQGKSYPW